MSVIDASAVKIQITFVNSSELKISDHTLLLCRIFNSGGDEIFKIVIN